MKEKEYIEETKKEMDIEIDAHERLLVGVFMAGIVFLIWMFMRFILFPTNNTLVNKCVDDLEKINEKVMLEKPIFEIPILKKGFQSYSIDINKLVLKENNITYYELERKCGEIFNQKNSLLHFLYPLIELIFGKNEHLELKTKEYEKIVKQIKDKINDIRNSEDAEIHFIVEETAFLKQDEKINVYAVKLKDININEKVYIEDILKLKKIK